MGKRDSSTERSTKNAPSTTSTKKKCGPGQSDPCPSEPPGSKRSTAKSVNSKSSYGDSNKDITREDSDEVFGQERRPEKYSPKPYTFRIPGPMPKNTVGDLCAVKSPPFIYQLDHTLAVVWILFSKDEYERPLGIVQLQWALNFLKGIYNQKGEHPKDINLCIEAIQEQLIEQYAGMANILPPAKKKGYCGAYNCKGEKKVKKTSTSQTSVKSTRSSKSSVGDEDSYRQVQTISREVPFSVNYADIIKHTGHTQDSGYTSSSLNVEQIYLRPIASSTLNDASKLGSIPSDSLNPQKSMEFLQTIRRQQIDKVQTELKTLHLIEDYIAHSEPDGQPVAQSTPTKKPNKSKIPKKGK